MLLVGDIGGTNTRLAVFAREQGDSTPLVKKKYPSQEYCCLEDIVTSFMKEHGLFPDKGVFGVAGPVKRNRARITNLPWIIDGEELQSATCLTQAVLLNDIQAMAYALPFLNGDDSVCICHGIEEKKGVKALIAPGTGLGMGFLTWDGKKYRAHGSEGGHTEFGPRTELEIELLNYLRQRFEHVSYERVCSGMGIPNLYAFLRDTGKYEEPRELREQFERISDITPVIVHAAVCEPDKYPICVAVVELFVSILAAQAGNLALTVACSGGLYIGGGIPPRILQYMHQKTFVRIFTDKGRLSAALRDIPIHLITRSDIALFGAACYGRGLY
ncbi:glucokinase [Desulfogranum japonicum]|uniref:glucokinase n=1 Tax=Desulfogranum japonicum TaxID=231447 RepID=UPI0004000D5A|nr:glucokinase [Desulfogranum japonicum]